MNDYTVVVLLDELNTLLPNASVVIYPVSPMRDYCLAL
jgi:hypothetical protein